MPAGIHEIFTIVKQTAEQVMEELGTGWKEEIYQKAMEVGLRQHGLQYENQRILPITFNHHVIGESIPDLVIWGLEDGKKVAVVVDLKADAGMKEDFEVQVQRYIKELRKQVKPGELVHHTGYVINFIKAATSKKMDNGYTEENGVQILPVALE